MKLVNNLLKYSGITLTVIAPLLTFSQQTFARTSSFQNSCNNSSIAGDTLSAVCRRRDGSFNNNASIRIRGIANSNGNLVFIGFNRASSFPSSCTNISIAGDTLSATCRRRDGSFNNDASIRVRGIKNNNGNLTY